MATRTPKSAPTKKAPAKSAHDADMMVDLHRSGLDASDAQLMQLEYCDKAPEGIKPLGRGYRIPYFDLNGEDTGFYRYRYLEDTRSGFERSSGVKQRRYTQPPNTTPQVYWAPYINWKEYCEGTEPLLITEGEKKAARSTKGGVPCIGLGGVWSFQNALRAEALLPELNQVNWDGRPVYIIYDSDAADKIQIQQAEYRLARRLMRAGAVVHVCRLPSLPDGNKMGLDDFIEHEGIEALEDVMESSQLFEGVKELHRLNTEVAYVKDPGIIYVLETGQQINTEGFKNHRFADRTYMKTTLTDKGPTMEERSTAADWLKWPGRNAVERIAFEPGQPSITPDGALNKWHGWPYMPKPGNVDPWHRLLDHLFKGQPESRLWAEKWCAYPFQHPGTKHRTALAVWGRKTGTGKSLLGYTLGDLYGDAFSEVGDEQIEKKDFNSWANGKQFVMGDDITGSNNRQVANALKTMITREKILINIKHIPEYYTRDCINYYFTSNSPDAFLLDENDRRFFIHEVTGGALPDEFYAEFDAWRRSEKGRRALMHHLVHEVNVEDFNPTAKAPMTEAKREMIAMTRTDLESWLSNLRENPDPFCRRFGDCDLVTIGEMMSVYDPAGTHRVTHTTFARKLKEMGIPRADAIDTAPGSQLRVAPNGELVRLYAVRNTPKWTNATAAALREAYESARRLKGAAATFKGGRK